jgi:hypothetical protein
MNKLSKEKKQHLILVSISAVIVLALIYFFLIRPQYDRISRIKMDTRAAQDKLLDIESAIKKSDATTASLADLSHTLSVAEDDMASGDTVAWTYDIIRHFKVPYKVDISTVGQPAIGDVDLIGNFPYKQLRFSISGTAYYHDLGRFIAGFENDYPHFRVVNLVLDPVGGTGDDAEKLSFRMDLIALVKSNGGQK